MLYQARDRAGAIQAIAGDFVRGYTLRTFCTHDYEEDARPTVLVDNLAQPAVLVAHAGANCMVYGALQHYIAVMGDLLHGRVEQDGGWPDELMRRDWERGEDGGAGSRGLFLNSSPFAVWRAACMASFVPDPEDLHGHVAYLWYFTGEPRFEHLVRHDCREGRGQELFELMRQGIGYDPEGRYVRLCLEHGPSFVCEVDGRPVCWSCTHLNGTMGMIYTPEEHRRHGYARSLAAFQIDTMLRRHGIACCHVIDHNVASMSMVASLGAQRCEEAIVWRGVAWPAAVQ